MPINNNREFKYIQWKIPNKTYAKLRAYSIMNKKNIKETGIELLEYILNTKIKIVNENEKRA